MEATVVGAAVVVVVVVGATVVVAPSLVGAGVVGAGVGAGVGHGSGFGRTESHEIKFLPLQTPDAPQSGVFSTEQEEPAHSSCKKSI